MYRMSHEFHRWRWHLLLLLLTSCYNEPNRYGTLECPFSIAYFFWPKKTKPLKNQPMKCFDKLTTPNWVMLCVEFTFCQLFFFFGKKRVEGWGCAPSSSLALLCAHTMRTSVIQRGCGVNYQHTQQKLFLLRVAGFLAASCRITYMASIHVCPWAFSVKGEPQALRAHLCEVVITCTRFSTVESRSFGSSTMLVLVYVSTQINI